MTLLKDDMTTQERHSVQFGQRARRNMKLERPMPRKRKQQEETDRNIYKNENQENITAGVDRKAPRGIKLDKKIPRKNREHVENNKAVTDKVLSAPTEAIEIQSSDREAISHGIVNHDLVTEPDDPKTKILTIPSREPTANILVTVKPNSPSHIHRTRNDRLGLIEDSSVCQLRKQRLKSVVGKVIIREYQYRKR